LLSNERKQPTDQFGRRLTMFRLPSAAQGSPKRAAGDPPAAHASAIGHDTYRGLTADDTQELLTDVGFLLVPGAPFDRGPAYLMVALRHAPTFEHFDPERIELWTPGDPHAGPAVLEWPLRSPLSSYSWGLIQLVDRLGKTNKFASFGGSVSFVRDRDINAAVFRSDAPILGAGGHSAPPDPLGPSLTTFFGILRAAAGNDRNLEGLIADATPQVLYAAFLDRSLAVYERPAHDAPSARLVSVLRQERLRLQQAAAEEQRRGASLAALIRTGL
jgi:hypothetical protein